MPRDGDVRIEAGFEPGRAGQLFCVRFTPAMQEPRAGVLFVHPFAEELNKSRHVVAHACRGLAAAGIASELVDLLGCGDSEGDLEHAAVDIWLDDLAARIAAMRARVDGPVHLWALRAGSLLAASLCARGDVLAGDARLLLWQPVTRGRQVVTDFLRIRAAASLMSGDRDRETADSLRARLADGEALEVAGYRLTPDLAAAMDALSLKEAFPGPRAIHWVDVSRDPTSALAPAASKLVDDWQAQGARVTVHRVEGPVFWSAGELEDCPALTPAAVTALADAVP